MQKVIGLLLAFSLIFSFGFVNANAVTTDPKLQSNALQLLQSLDILVGYPDGELHPNDTLTRAQAAQILLRISSPYANQLSVFSGQPAFEDTAGHWANQAIYYAKLEGTMAGYNSTTFGPDDNLSVVQALKILICKANPLRKINPSSWVSDTLAYAAYYGIYVSYPEEAITRDQFALYAVIINSDQILDTYNVDLQLVYDEWGTPSFQYFSNNELIEGAPFYSLPSITTDEIDTKTLKKYLESKGLTYPETGDEITFYVNGILQKKATIRNIENYCFNNYIKLTFYHNGTDIISATAIVYDFAVVSKVTRKGVVSYDILYSPKHTTGTTIVDEGSVLYDAGAEVGDYVFVIASTVKGETTVLEVEFADYYVGSYEKNRTDLREGFITLDLGRRQGTVSFEVADYEDYKAEITAFTNGDEVEIIVHNDEIIMFNNLTNPAPTATPTAPAAT